MKRQKPVADQVHRRLMTGAEQQDDIGGQFLSCEFIAVFLSLNEMRGEVVARLASAQLKQLAEIFGHCQVAGILFFDFGLAKWRQVEQTSASARAGEEDVPGLLGDAEHVTDHGNRKPESEVRDEIHPAARLHAIDDLIDDFLNT